MAKIGELQIEVVPNESTEIKNEVTEKPVENEANIADHINHRPIEFSVDFVLAGPNAENNRDQLEKMSQEDDVFKYTDVKNNRVYEDMVITDLNFDTDVSISDGYTGTLALKQIQIATQQTIPNLGTDPASGEQIQSNAEETEKRDPEEDEADEDSADASFLASLFGIGDD